MDFETVFETFNSAEANLIASQLEVAGFEPTILNEFSTLTLGAPNTAGGIRVQVAQGRAADARALVHSTIDSDTKPTDINS
ncbi:MAG: DUF2007 domain-containing protein [Verrucomicrobiota bacterium]